MNSLSQSPRKLIKQEQDTTTPKFSLLTQSNVKGFLLQSGVITHVSKIIIKEPLNDVLPMLNNTIISSIKLSGTYYRFSRGLINRFTSFLRMSFEVNIYSAWLYAIYCHLH